jgi:hypothetical protein
MNENVLALVDHFNILELHKSGNEIEYWIVKDFNPPISAKEQGYGVTVFSGYNIDSFVSQIQDRGIKDLVTRIETMMENTKKTTVRFSGVKFFNYFKQ